MYVSIKNRILTPSGPKKRVCVNTLDRLTPPGKTLFSVFAFSFFAFLLLLPFLPFTPARHQKLAVALPSLNSPERMQRRWLVLSEFAKYAFFWPDKKKSCF